MMRGIGELSNVEKIEGLLEKVSYKRIDNHAEMEAVQRLRYDAYLKEGAVAERQDRKLADDFDWGENVYNIGIYISGELASALRLHVVDHFSQRSPALESFGEILRPELTKGRRIIDPNRFVANYELARQYPFLPYVTLRPTFLASTYFSGNLVTMTCRAEHQAFYKRGFYARPVCAPRAYPLLTKPIGLLLVDFDADAGKILERHPYWSSSAAERATLFGPGPTYQDANHTKQPSRPRVRTSRPQHDGHHAAKMLVGIGDNARSNPLEA
jgi:hypothetical protein